MILMIDNYDSFTYNIVHYLQELGYLVQVERNDAVTIPEILNIRPSHIIISPGPSNPDHAGISLQVIKELIEIPILGICLGHQCIGQSFGGKIVRSKNIYHGKSSSIIHEGKSIFQGIPSPFTAIRYHSLVIEKDSFPENELEILAYSEDHEIMAVKHRSLPIEGIQFHPESIGSKFGKELLENFLKYYR